MPSNHLILSRPLFLGLLSFPASGAFSMSQFFTSGGQSIDASASVSVLPVNIQGLFPLGLMGLISLLSKGLSRVFSNSTVQKHQFFGTQLSLQSNSHIHTDYWKSRSFDQMDLCWQSNVSAFEYAIQVGHNFSSEEQASFNFMAAITICSDFGAPQNKVSHCFHCIPIYLP